MSRTILTIWCLPADVVDSSTVASLGATQNYFSNIGSALSPVIGALYGATGSFELPLVLTGAVVIAGALCFGLLIKKVEPLRRITPPAPLPDTKINPDQASPALAREACSSRPCTTGKSLSPVPN